MIDFNSCNFESMCRLMDEHKKSHQIYTQKNKRGEDIVISIFKDRIVVYTYQHNGWIKQNTYWKHGEVEEVFNGKWDK